jgi:hypothetical protein
MYKDYSEACTYLNTVNSVKHEDDKPMNKTWRRDAPSPGKTMEKTNKLAVGESGKQERRSDYDFGKPDSSHIVVFRIRVSRLVY